MDYNMPLFITPATLVRVKKLADNAKDLELDIGSVFYEEVNKKKIMRNSAQIAILNKEIEILRGKCEHKNVAMAGGAMPEMICMDCGHVSY